MNIRSGVATTVFGLIALLSSVTIARAAELKVLCSGGLRPAVEDLGPKFERATGHKLLISFATVGAIAKRVHDGDASDVVITTFTAIESFVNDGKAKADSAAVIAHSALGLAVRKGAPKPDISTSEAFKRALLAAKAITYPSPAGGGVSGVYFETLLDRLGIATEVRAKTVFPKAGPSALLVVNGEADLAITQIQELAAVTGLEVVGPLPKDLQQITVFSGVVMARAATPEVATQLIRFLQTPEAAAVIKAKGFEPGAP